ncbi:serine protease Do, partial [Tindallia magadiensis]
TIDKPHMIVNGVAEEIDPGRGTVPIITSGRTMVPIRAIVEAMGGTVGWDGGESKITLNARGNQVEMWLNRNEIRANGSMGRMDVAPVSIGGRTFVPLRFSTDNLDARAEWINSTREVVIIF